MPISAKRKLVAGATGLAVLAGAGGAYAAGQSNSTAPPKPPDRAARQKAFLDDVAKRLNVPRDQLDAALKGAAEARIDAAVAAGRLTKEQGEAAKQRLQNGLPLLGPGPVPGGRGFDHGFHHHLDGVADYLGLTEAQLREQLGSGKSLADVAKAQNKSVDGLKAKLKGDITEKLDEAVKDGRLTQAQKSRMLANIDQRLDAIINRTPPSGGPPRGFRRWR